MDLLDHETRCVDAEGRAHRFGAQISGVARWAVRQKTQKPQNTFFGLNPLLAQQLGLESIRGENLAFFQ